MGQVAILLNGMCFNVVLLLMNYDFFRLISNVKVEH